MRIANLLRLRRRAYQRTNDPVSMSNLVQLLNPLTKSHHEENMENNTALEDQAANSCSPGQRGRWGPGGKLKTYLNFDMEEDRIRGIVRVRYN
jgi:hypothetical protein